MEYKKYKFKIEEITDKKILEAYQAIKIYTKKIDNEILLLTLDGGGTFSLYLQDRFFNFNIDDETKRISSFDGEIKVSEINIEKLRLPENIKQAVLTLNTTDELSQGAGSYVEFKTDHIAYDNEKKILQIGEINDENVTYKFFHNAYTQIQNGELSGIMFTDLEM